MELSGTLSTIVGGIGPTKSLVPMQTMSSVFEIIGGIIKKMFTSEYGGIFTLILGPDPGASSQHRTYSSIVKEDREPRGRGLQLLSMVV